MNARFGNARKGLEELLFYDIDLLATEDPARWVEYFDPQETIAVGAARAVQAKEKQAKENKCGACPGLQRPP